MNANDLQLYLQLENRIQALESGASGTSVDLAALEAQVDSLDLANSQDVTLGTPNGLSMAAHQVLSLAVATTASAGALSAYFQQGLESRAFVAVDPTISNFVTAFNAAKTQAVARGLKHIHFGDGTWTCDCGGLTDESAMVTIPSGFSVTGNGFARSIISVTNTSTGAGQNGVAVMRCDANSSNSYVAGLHFVGTNNFSYILNNQNTCLEVHWTGTSRDVLFERCKFENLFGFAIHDRQGTTNERIHVMGCTFLQCANGVNVNANYSIQAGNIFDNSEGFETSGAHVVIANNTFRRALGVAATIGGNQSGGTFPGCVVIGNTVNGSTGAGITVTDGAADALVANNTVRLCELGGLVVHGAVTVPVNCAIVGNIFDSNCISGGANVVGMDIQGGSGHHIALNQSVDSGVVGFDQRYGLSLAASDCTVFGNRFKGTFKDASFGTGATDTNEEGNTFVNRNEEWISTATKTPKRMAGKNGTDLAIVFRRWNGSPSDIHGYFGMYYEGTLAWGDHSGGTFDTYLYRLAASKLATLGAFHAAGKITGAADLVVGSDVLHVDSANGRVGINVASPTQPFEVDGNQVLAGLGRFRNTAANGFSSFACANAAGTTRFAFGYGNTGAAAPFADKAYLYYQSVPLLVVYNNGAGVDALAAAFGTDLSLDVVGNVSAGGNIAATGTVTGSNLSGTHSGTNTGDQAAGAGLTGTTTLNVGAHADGSIVVNANDIQVGVLASDAQHGDRGGGSLHALAVASGASGFLSGTDKAKLDSISYGNGAEPWFLPRKPASVHADDDEFESGLLTGWTTGGTLSGSAIDLYTNYTTAATWRASNNVLRPSTLLIQPPADGATLFPIHKAHTYPTNQLIWARLFFFSRYTATISNGDHSVGIYLTATSGGAPSTADNIKFFLTETDANEYAIEWGKTEGGVATNTEAVLSLGQERLSFDHIAIHKLGSTYHFWVAPSNGNWAHLGSVTYAGAALDRVALFVSNAATTAPGNMVVGVDFIRFADQATFLA